MGHQFIIRTNQQALRHLCKQTIQTPEQQCWLPKLLGFDFVIEYKPGRDNLAADALSSCFTLTSSQSQASFFFSELQLLQQQDKFYGPIMTSLIDQNLQNSDYSLRQGLLCWKTKLVIPNDDGLKQRLLKDFHNSLLG